VDCEYCAVLQPATYWVLWLEPDATIIRWLCGSCYRRQPDWTVVGEIH
jgi:hypothetical protein